MTQDFHEHVYREIYPIGHWNLSTAVLLFIRVDVVNATLSAVFHAVTTL